MSDAGAPRLSVVVVSHGRPRALRRCLIGLYQQMAGGIEVVVVADREGLDLVAALPFADRIKVAEQAQPNISEARNAGVALAAGEVVGFIDDDAVPEPTWAAAIQRAFSDDPALMAATGPVLGRNGISLQWRRVGVDRLGRDWPAPDPTTPLRDDLALKLHGTNMAARRAVFERLGGFDPGFAFYLDDTDLARRIMSAGMRAAWVADAVVHHGFAASTRRTEARVPLSLFDIGASSAVFLRKHGASAAEMAAALAELEGDQRARLLRLARARKLGAREMRGLMESLAEGVDAGRARAFGAPGVDPASTEFRPLRDAPPPPPVVLAGWLHRATPLRAAAAAAVENGGSVSLFLFEPTPRKHKVAFTDGGWWEQTGGLYGPSDRSGPRLQVWSLSGRKRAEIARIGRFRGLGGEP